MDIDTVILIKYICMYTFDEYNGVAYLVWTVHLQNWQCFVVA